MKIKIEDLPAAIGRKCEEALAEAQRIHELDWLLDDANNDERTRATARRINGLENELCETQDSFREAMLTLQGMVAAFETRVRAVALYDGFEA